MPNANAFSFSAENGKKYHKQYMARKVETSSSQTTVTYYYRQTNGEHGSTTTLGNIPAGAVVIARITT